MRPIPRNRELFERNILFRVCQKPVASESMQACKELDEQIRTLLEPTDKVGTTPGSRCTSFPGIEFDSGGGYLILQPTGPALSRTREEAELHVLLQSHVHLANNDWRDGGDSLFAAAVTAQIAKSDTRQSAAATSEPALIVGASPERAPPRGSMPPSPTVPAAPAHAATSATCNDIRASSSQAANMPAQSPTSSPGSARDVSPPSRLPFLSQGDVAKSASAAPTAPAVASALDSTKTLQPVPEKLVPAPAGMPPGGSTAASSSIRAATDTLRTIVAPPRNYDPDGLLNDKTHWGQWNVELNGDVLNDTHEFQRVSPDRNGCWWRSTLLSVLVQGNAERMRTALEEKARAVQVRRLEGRDINQSIEAFCHLAKTARERGVSSVLESGGRFKLPKSSGISFDNIERHCRDIVRLILQGDVEESALEKRLNSSEYGNNDYMALIMQCLGGELVILNPGHRRSANRSGGMPAHILVDLKDGNSLQAKLPTSREACVVDEIRQVLRGIPIIVHQGRIHFDVYLPKTSQDNTTDQGILERFSHC